MNSTRFVQRDEAMEAPLIDHNELPSSHSMPPVGFSIFWPSASSKNVAQNTFGMVKLCYVMAMNVAERKIWYLRRVNLFADLPPGEIERIADRLRMRTCSRRETVLDPHSPGDRIYLVKSGAVRVYRLSAEGRQLTTAILRPGQLFGTSALIGVGQRPVFAEAMEDTCLCEANADEFLRLVSAHPLLAARVMVALARQALRLEQHLEQLAFQEVPMRLAQTLIELCEDNGGELPSPLTHEEIANLAGTTRETVTKQLALFAEEGLIEMGYRRVAIMDAQGLRRRAGLDDAA